MPPGATPTRSAALEIQVTRLEGPGVRVLVEGELDLSSSPRLQPVLDRELAGAPEVILDLSGTEFIDSAGLRAILAAIEQARSSGGKLMISSTLPAQVRRLFELTGLIGQLPLSAE